MKIKVKIWDALNGEEDYAKEVEVDDFGEPLSGEANSLRWAVETFVEKGWSDSDYPEVTEISVRDPGGALIEFEVYAEQSVNFRAVSRVSK